MKPCLKVTNVLDKPTIDKFNSIDEEFTIRLTDLGKEFRNLGS